MYIISKFESFSNQPDIEEIKDIFQDLVDKWDMVFDSTDSKEIRHYFWTDPYLKTFMKVINVAKEIEDKDDVYFIISIDLTGPNDFYTTLYKFNKDCEDLLKRFQSEFNCELITAYGSPYLQSKGIPTSQFLFVFRSELKFEHTIS
jgi:hypothetical protein